MLVVVQRCCFARRTCRHNAGDTTRDLEFDQVGKRLFIDLSVPKGSNDCRVSACEHDLESIVGRLDKAPVGCEWNQASSICPSKTSSAGPVSVTWSKCCLAFSNPTTNRSPLRTRTGTGLSAWWSFAWISADAATPVPQAMVSCSTPRS